MVVFVRWNGMGFESKLRDFGETNNQRVILSEGRRVTPPKSNFCAMKKVARQLYEWSKSARRVRRSGIYEGIPIAFFRKLTSFKRKGIARLVTRSQGYALPSLGSGSTTKTVPRTVFFAQDDS